MNNKTVTIIGSLHGDERIGAEVLDLLKSELATQKTDHQINLILGNPAAYEANKRFIDQDLNRLFGPDFAELKSLDPSQLDTEQKRALELAPVLAQSDYLLDIHSTIKPSVPFVYCEPGAEHLSLAALFESDYIVSPSASHRPADLNSSTDNFVDANGGLGLTYETGWHKDLSDTQNVLQKVKLFLKTIGAAFTQEQIPQPKKQPQRLEIYHSLIPASEEFKYTEDFTNFQFFPKGAKIAQDATKEIIASEDSFLIFPKTQITKNKAAGYLARPLN